VRLKKLNKRLNYKQLRRRDAKTLRRRKEHIGEIGQQSDEGIEQPVEGEKQVKWGAVEYLRQLSMRYLKH
jgi:hypothetical protein|tara:strand:- start:1373 stop:1582 length:210 start_codon:yes stop_codon:yes gene_type:complete